MKFKSLFAAALLVAASSSLALARPGWPQRCMVRRMVCTRCSLNEKPPVGRPVGVLASKTISVFQWVSAETILRAVPSPRRG